MSSFIVRCIVLALSLLAVTQLRVSQNALEIAGTEYKNSPERPASPVLVWKQDRPVEGFNLSFEARYDDSSYGNFFQTSDGQNSIRLEVQPPGKVFLILAETTVVPLKSDWRRGDWHRLSLQATKSGIDISVDGQPALHSVAPGGWALDNVAVGTGLGMKRGLIGAVRDVRLVVALPSKLSPLLFIFAVAAGSLLYAFLCKSLSAPSSFPWTDGGLTSPPLAAALFGIGVFANGSIHLPNAWLVAPVCFGLAGILLAVLRDSRPASVRRSELHSVLTASLLVLIPLALVFGVIGLHSSAIRSITYWLIGVLAPVAVAVLGPENTHKEASGRWTSLLTTALGCMAIVCTVTLCLQNDLWSAPMVGLALVLALRWTVPTTGTIGYLRPLYWTGASLVLVAISTKLAASHLALRPLLGLVATAITFAFTDRILFTRVSPKRSIELFFLPLAFNLSILTLSYLSTLDFGLNPTDFRVGYTFANFSDFKTLVGTGTADDYQWIQTGHLPLAYILSKTLGYLMHWTQFPVHFSPRQSAIYLLYLCVSLSPLALLLNRLMAANDADVHERFFATVFILTCYPILFVLERGNYVVVSCGLLTMTIYSIQRDRLRLAAMFAGLLISFKIINIVYLLFVIHRLRPQIGVFIATVFGATMVSLLILFQLDTHKWVMFVGVVISPLNAVLSDAPQHMRDWGILAGGTTGFEAVRVLLRSLLLNVQQDSTSDWPLMDQALLALGFATIVFFYLRLRQQHDAMNELLFLAIVPMLTHPASASYNLLLLLPPLLVIAARPLDLHNEAMLRLSIPIFLLSGGIGVALVSLGSEADGTVLSTSITPESYLVPFSLFGMCTVLLGVRLDSKALRRYLPWMFDKSSEDTHQASTGHSVGASPPLAVTPKDF